VAAVGVDEAIQARRSLRRDAKDVLDHRRDLLRRVELMVLGASELGSRLARGMRPAGIEPATSRSGGARSIP
jgi:hypothetical protein